ncbi:hypothetical protein SAMN05428971_0046 [Candidatus Pantoea varia]|uniref:Uncharacterized protein n=1 Tax=Candidatus Pantoea varia TaxID=1881036 RepID=A0A1I4W9M2_9GAMM|nr:hypothetical protein SAMN05428971_0046 [Pantoea varia]
MITGFREIVPEDHRHKKARRAFTLRALRTSRMVLVRWRSLNSEFFFMNIKENSEFNLRAYTKAYTNCFY